MASTFGIHREGTRSFPSWVHCVLLVNFVHSVVCSNLIVGGWMWSRKSYLGPTEIMYMCDGHIDIIECIGVNIWCILDWIWSQNCRNSLLLHTAFKKIGSCNL